MPRILLRVPTEVLDGRQHDSHWSGPPRGIRFFFGCHCMKTLPSPLRYLNIFWFCYWNQFCPLPPPPERVGHMAPLKIFCEDDSSSILDDVSVLCLAGTMPSAFQLKKYIFFVVKFIKVQNIFQALYCCCTLYTETDESL
jgi:hypothetical protein